MTQMTRCAFTTLLTSALCLMLGCRTIPQPGGPAHTLLAVVEEPERLVVVRQSGRQWTPVGQLPKSARALRIAQDGSALAWIADNTTAATPTMHAFVWKVGSDAPREVGTLGLRRAEEMGLAITPAGEAVWLDENGELRSMVSEGSLGQGHSPVVSDGDQLTYVTRANCLSGVQPPLCGTALRPLEWSRESLLARTNTELIEQRGTSRRTFPLRDVLDAHRDPRTGDILVVHRVEDEGVTREALSLWRSNEEFFELTRADVIIEAQWDNASIVLVRKQARADAYESLLAHAPEEFGGEALAGDAVRFDLETKTERPIEGLSGKLVRQVSPVPLRERP